MPKTTKKYSLSTMNLLVCLNCALIQVAPAETLTNQNVNNPSGTVVNNVILNSGGPYSINNRGTMDGDGVTETIKSNVAVDIINSGSISGETSGADAIEITGASISSSLNNSGTISAIGSRWNVGAHFKAPISSIINSGIISSASTEKGSNAIRLEYANVETIINSGTLSSTAPSSSVTLSVMNSADYIINSIVNSGAIKAFGDTSGAAIGGWGNINLFVNSGTISNEGATAYVSGAYGRGGTQGTDKIINSGIISGDTNGIAVQHDMTSITNTGSIIGGVSGIYVDNTIGSIGTLSNSQSDLTYRNKLPDNYKIIINSSTDFGKITFSSPTQTTNFGIDPSSVITAEEYKSVLSGISTSALDVTSGTWTGDGISSAGSTTWTLTETTSGSETWDLNITGGDYFYFGTIAALESSIAKVAQNVRGSFNSITASMNFANMTTYDCNLFGNNNGCISVGYRYTDTDNPNTTSTAAVVKVGYKLNEYFRYGAFVDQTISWKSRNIDITTDVPMLGFMAVWNQHPNQLGMQLKLANTYQRVDATIKRYGVNSLSHSGQTDINSHSYVAQLSWRYLNSQENKLLHPFLAMRYASVDQGGFSDGFVRYGSVEQKTYTALAGIKSHYRYNPKVTFLGSLGLEHDMAEDVDDLSVTVNGLSTLTTASMSDNRVDKTRLLGSLGIKFFVSHNQRLESKIMFEKLRYNNATSTTAYINYVIGF
jgi:hypothetical protein